MSQLERMRGLTVMNSNSILLEMSLDLRQKTQEDQRKRFGGSQKAGWFYLHSNDDKRPDTVFECVVSEAGDYVSAIYKGHPTFNSIGEHTRVREALIDELAGKIGLSHDMIGVPDEARGRDLGLNELATGQLIDLLEEQSRGSLITGMVDNHGLGHVDTEGTTRREEVKVGKGKIDDAHVLVMGKDGKVTPRALKDLDS